jgi:ankyrin repeat protein
MRALLLVAILIALLAAIPHLVQLLPIHIRADIIGIHTAANTCDNELVLHLLSNSVNSHGLANSPDQQFGWTPIMYATYLRGQEICRMTMDLLVQNGADVNGQDKNGKTALHHAIKGNALEGVLFLLSHRANAELAG